MCKSENALAPEERPVCREDLGGLLRNILSEFLSIDGQKIIIEIEVEIYSQSKSTHELN